MFIRIVTGIREHFEARFIEWAMATAIAVWGFNLGLIDPETFANSRAWERLLRIGGQDFWAVACMSVGIAWLLALAINGTFARTVYSRYSPYVRALAALCAAVVWFHVFWSVASAGTSGRGAYWLHLGLSIWCVFHTWRETGRGPRNAGT